MKTPFFPAIFLLFATSVQAESILGRWHDKNDPSADQFEFVKGHDFIHTHRWEHQGKPKITKSIGVWETGAWKVASPNGGESSCNLMIYAGSKECCFDFKFIAANLVITKKYADQYSGSMCDNRVLVKDER